MGIGAVVRVELAKASRRRRTYLIRSIVAAAMLWALWLGYGWFRLVGEMPFGIAGWTDPRHLPALAMAFFVRLVRLELGLIPLIVPGMVAGAIAEEDRRRTMLDLLTTRLTSAEIALGKLLGKLAQVAAAGAVVLPVAAFAVVYDGLDWVVVGASVAMVAMMGLVVGSASLFLSTLFRRPRGAIVAAYGLMAVWLIGIPMAAEVTAYVEGPIASRLRGPLEILTRSNPFFAGSHLDSWAEVRRFDPEFHASIIAWAFPGLLRALAWSIGSQALASAFFLIGAVALLRPVRVGVRGRPWWHRRGSKRSKGRVGPDPPSLGDDPIGWKERYLPEGAAALSNRWVVVAMAALTVAVLADPARLAVLEWFRGGSDRERGLLNGWLRGGQMALGLLWMLIAAVIGSGSIAGEREKGTWESLTATPLTGREVVRGKVFGALWATRGLAAPCVVLWGIGLIGGAVHPMGVVASSALLAALVPFAASLGVGCSMVAPNGNRALWSTLAALLGSQLFIVLFVALPTSARGEIDAALAGIGPAMLRAALLSFEDAASLRDAFASLGTREGSPAVFVGLFAVLAMAYAVAGLAIQRWASRRYDAGPDRSTPRRRPIDRPEAPPGDRERLRTCVGPLPE